MLANSRINTTVNKTCENCNTALTGQFCHSCGQSSKSMIKFFKLYLITSVFLSMKRFYKQSWKMTITKTLSLRIVYMVFGAYQA